MINKVFFLKELKQVLKDEELAVKVFRIFETLQEMDAKERKEKQLAGIERARMEGKKLGRPKLREPENFHKIAAAWSRKELTAAEAANLCGMGTSTFYRRVGNYKSKKNKADGK